MPNLFGNTVLLADVLTEHYGGADAALIKARHFRAAAVLSGCTRLSWQYVDAERELRRRIEAGEV